MTGTHVLVMAKAPVPGTVKTRLSPPCSLEEAATLAEAALADTLAAVAASGADRRIVGLDGVPGPWLPPGFEVVPQCDGPFDRRLAHAWAAAGGPGVQIGMDTPQVTGGRLDDALAALDRTQAALGHAPDGGWWAIGLRRPDPAVFLGVPMSTGRTGRMQEARLRALGLDVTRLPDLVDLDTVGDLPAVVAAAPTSRTARVAARLGLVAGAHPTGPGLGDAVVLRAETGETVPLLPSRWLAAATTEEQALLDSVEGPVIDLGCGPGRLVLSLARRGVPVLGVDSSPSAVALARRHGAAVLERDVFGRLPGEGRWATALLFDGNIGMGGDPGRLLARCRQLTGGRGRVIVEVEPPGATSRRLRAWLERDGVRSATFPWAVVGADTITAVSRSAGLHVAMMATTTSGRWFANLEPSA